MEKQRLTSAHISKLIMGPGEVRQISGQEHILPLQRTKVSFQHLCGSSQLPVTSLLEDLMPSSAGFCICDTCKLMKVHTHTHTHINNKQTHHFKLH